MIERFSSRRERLGGFLAGELPGARRYDRIAGYFRSSLLEVAGEALEAMADGAVVRVICNSDLDPLDVATARAAKRAQYREWCSSLPADASPALRTRLERLYGFLCSGRLQVRVLPDACFGLIHGKAGVIERADGSRLAFIGSANESRSAWTLNYELLWTDRSAEGVAWVDEEFRALWGDPRAVELAEAVVREIERVTRRVVIPTVTEWGSSAAPDPAAPVIELPVYRQENGLWAHQKAFIKRAFEAHVSGGARLLLADQVGLGKTVQLALAAKLMALWGRGPVLVLVPRALMAQWQGELWSMLALPSAVWTGRGWRDEQGVFHPQPSPEGLARCPRRVGIVSTGQVTQSAEAAAVLATREYECVILDEAHRARRRNLGGAHRTRNEKADPNKLLAFMLDVARHTRSLLMATATPVQLDPIEAFDLLTILGERRDEVLGSRYSPWRVQAREGLALVSGRVEPPAQLSEVWEWMRNPLPPADESRDFRQVRGALGLGDRDSFAAADALDRLRPPDRARVERLAQDLFQRHNPYIRHIVRRTRAYLEGTLDPETGEAYLPKVRVRLFGERADEALTLPNYLRDAYEAAERFCDLLGGRPGLSSGFLKTMLLRRVGSTIEAGRRTARMMLGMESPEEEVEAEEDEPPEEAPAPRSALYPLTDAERKALLRCLELLEREGAEDPKAREVERILLEGSEGTRPWLEEGCIVFSQYYDSAFWLGQHLSVRLPEETVALYAGIGRSGVIRDGYFTRRERDAIKESVQRGEIRLILGTDAASEGLNLQRLGRLINLDLPWNPTRLEQRKGRIQRIGQVRDEVFIANLRYGGSVEDRVHQLLSNRLQAIHDLFGQLPDTLEDAWIAVALQDQAEAERVIGAALVAHPFEIRYDRIEPVDWESCARVLDQQSQLAALTKGW